MKWQRGHKSEYVEDRRGTSAGGGGGGGGRRGKMGIGTIIIALIGFVFFKKDVFGLLSGGGAQGSSGSPVAVTGTQKEKEFASFVFDDVQKVWNAEFKKMGKSYRPARLVLFSGDVSSGCGIQGSDVGPFYCGADNKAYIDLSFNQQLAQQLGAKGDFAQAFVLAHEVGHHVQNVLGISDKTAQMKRRDPRNKNKYSVMQELQADCFAGIWAHDTAKRDMLHEGDVEEAITAANKIGDDWLQKNSGRRVNPELFTHGTSAQRMKWFSIGFKSGDVNQCDTFQ